MYNSDTHRDDPLLDKPRIGDRILYKRIPIRRRTPPQILDCHPIEDGEDLARRLRLIAEWYNDFAPGYNICIDIAIRALTDDEAAAIEAEERAADNEAATAH